MSNKNLLFIPDSYLIDNALKVNLPYRARNILSSNIHRETISAQEVPSGQQPAQETTPEQDLTPRVAPEDDAERVGYISVGVFTASGALPVEDAVVTVYIIDNEGEENVISHLVTDANGQVPTIELPVYYNRLSPIESPEYYFSTYNLRVQAINYYTVNILDFRIFPNTTTNFNIELIPVAAGPGGIGPDTTYVIPPSPIDISNE